MGFWGWAIKKGVNIITAKTIIQSLEESATNVIDSKNRSNAEAQIRVKKHESKLSAPSSVTEKIDALQKLKELYDAGVITKGQFNRQKNELLK